MADDAEAQREANRARYPSIAAIVDQMREHFPGATVTAVRTMTDEKKKLLEDYGRNYGRAVGP